MPDNEKVAGGTGNEARLRGEERQRRMEALLRVLYRHNLWTEAISHPAELSAALGWPEAAVDEAGQDLVHRRFAEWKESGGGIGLTSFGIATLEALVLGPAQAERPTGNEIRIGDASGVQIQQGSSGGTQQMGSDASQPVVSDDPDRELVSRRQARRLDILAYLYEQSGGDTNQLVPWRDAMRATGVEGTDEFVGHMVYLGALGLADMFTMDSVRILPDGVDRIEQAEQHPSERSPGLASMNVLIIESATNVQVQQGTQGGVQIQSFDEPELEAIRLWLEDYEAWLNEPSLDEDARQQAVVAVAVAREQVAAEQPRSTLLRGALHALYDLAISAIGSGTGSVIAAELLKQRPVP